MGAFSLFSLIGLNQFKRAELLKFLSRDRENPFFETKSGATLIDPICQKL
jgi:hypothetical protein